MQIDHPHAHPLTAREQALLEEFRRHLHSRISGGGLTATDVRQIVEAMQGHPEASLEALRILRQEAQALLPRQSLISFDWD